MGHICDEDGFPSFEIGLDVGGVVNYSLDIYFELLSFEFSLYLVEGSECVGIMDVDEMRFDVVRDGFVVFGFPEGGLSCSAVQPILSGFD